MARLASVGLVRIVPHRGVFVADVSTEELVDLYTVREVLEEQAARLAVDRLTDAAFATVERLAEDMAAAARAGDLEGVLKHNRELDFHALPRVQAAVLAPDHRAAVGPERPLRAPSAARRSRSRRDRDSGGHGDRRRVPPSRS